MIFIFHMGHANNPGICPLLYKHVEIPINYWTYPSLRFQLCTTMITAVLTLAPEDILVRLYG